MFFQKKQHLDTWEARLTDTLDGIIGRCRECCKKTVTEEDFEIADRWEKRLGFIREDDKKIMFLVLWFKDWECCNYQLLIRQHGQPWKKAHMIAFKKIPGPACI